MPSELSPFVLMEPLRTTSTDPPKPPAPPDAPSAIPTVPTRQARPTLSLMTTAMLLPWRVFISARSLAQVPPLLLMTLRFFLVAILLFPFLKVQPGRMGQLAVVSVALGGMHYSLMFVGLSGVDAGPASIAVQLMVPFSAVLAWAFFRERLEPRQIAGMLIAFVGVYVLGGDPDRAPDTYPA